MDWSEIRDMLGLDITPDQLRKMAVGYDEYNEYITQNGFTATRVLGLSDFHVPFNLPLETFNCFANKVDILVLNGDIEDCQGCSKYSKTYRVPIVEEMVETRNFLIDLIHLINPKEVYVVKGNHEHRMSKYLSKVVSEDMMNIMPDTPMDLIINEGFYNRDRRNKTQTWYEPLADMFEDEGIEIHYDGSFSCKVGKVIFCHPITYSNGMLKTTEKAVDHFLRQDRDFEAIVMAHTHKLGSYYQGNIELYEQGCCCDLTKFDYNDGMLTLPSQNGCIYMHLDTDGSILKNKTKLIKF